MVVSRLSGLGAWLVQRITALYLAVYLPLYAGAVWAWVEGYGDWLALNAHPAVAAANLLGFTAVLLHSWVGMRDVVIDYIKPTGLRIALLVLIGTALGLMALWTLRIYLVLAL